MNKFLFIFVVFVFGYSHSVLAGGSDVPNARSSAGISDEFGKFGLLKSIFANEDEDIAMLSQQIARSKDVRSNCFAIETHMRSKAIMVQGVLGSEELPDGPLKPDEVRQQNLMNGFKYYFNALKLADQSCRSKQKSLYYLDLARQNAQAVNSALQRL